MNNPYDFLGINRNATEQEAMDAYRKIANNIQNSNIADSEKKDKMAELDKAYDFVLNELRGTTAYATNSYSTNQNSNQNSNQNDASQFYDIRERINDGRIDDAETILNGIPENMRTAEWFYLKGCIHQRRGWLNEAFNCFQTAATIDPSNMEYRDALSSMQKNATGGYRTAQKSSSCSACDVCSGLICADCCCECLGGDLIPCC